MVKVADEVWIATALLHREQPARRSFSVGEIVARTVQEGLHLPLRPGVQIHASQHCVANKPPNPGTYRMLLATPDGGRRLFRRGDEAHPARTGKITPHPDELPEAYQALLAWYATVYDMAPSNDAPESLPSIADAERSVLAATERDLVESQSLLIRILNTHLEGFRRLGKYTLKEDRDPRVLLLALVTRAFNSAWCAYGLVRRGYYQQAVALARMIDEDWLTSYDVAFNEETRQALWERRRPKRSFKAIAQDMTKDDGAWWDQVYGTTSEISHPRGLSLAMQFEKGWVRLGPIYDRDLALGSLVALVGATKRMLKVLNHTFALGLEEQIEHLQRDIGSWLLWAKGETPVAKGLSIEPGNGDV